MRNLIAHIPHLAVCELVVPPLARVCDPCQLHFFTN
jgi:hypothetical protein